MIEKEGSHMYHFIGIKGTGMAALAQIMKNLGYEVKGSDITEHCFTDDALNAAGIYALMRTISTKMIL